jgi:hypothetical protein
VQRAPVPQDREGVAPEAVAGRLDDDESDRRGERGVDRVATAGQHGETRLGRERLRGRDDVARKDRGPA